MTAILIGSVISGVPTLLWSCSRILIMLKKEFTQLLQTGSALNGNNLAKNLFKSLVNRNFNIEKSKDKKEYDWEDIASLSLEDVSVPNPEKIEDRDQLFKEVRIKGIKKFPANDLFYRLDFTNQSLNPVSCVIMGVNGAGKSSFFGALELVGMRMMNTAKLRGMSPWNYITNLFASEEEVEIILKTSYNTVLYNSKSKDDSYVPQAFYISEWDIRELEPLEDFGEFIYEQLGLKNFNELISLLEKTKKIIDENLESKKKLDSDIDKIKKDLSNLSDYLSNIEKNKKYREPNAKIKKIIKNHNSDDPSALNCLKKLERDLAKNEKELNENEIYVAMGKIADIEKVKDLIVPLIDELKKRFNERISQWMRDYINPVLKELLKDYIEEDNLKLEISYIPSSRKIAVKLTKPAEDTLIETPNIQSPDGGQQISSVGNTNPRAYFNTFRFKMFAVSLKIACACCAKFIYKRNLPIIIDDVFNSSDFGNRLKMGHYIKRIHAAYHTVDSLLNMPLQIIFFTQDDIIATSVFHGLEDVKEEAKLIRLHDYHCFSSDKEMEDKDFPNNRYVDVFSVVATYPMATASSLMKTISKKVSGIIFMNGTFPNLT